MAQAISLAILTVAILILQARKAAEMAGLGAWGEALGRLVVGPVLVFFVVQAVLFYGTKLVRGHMGHSFATSRLNYVSLAITILSILGRVAQDAAQRIS